MHCMVYVFVGGRISVCSLTGLRLLVAGGGLPIHFANRRFAVSGILVGSTVERTGVDGRSAILSVKTNGKFLAIRLLGVTGGIITVRGSATLIRRLQGLFSSTQGIRIINYSFEGFTIPGFPFGIISGVPCNVASSVFGVLVFRDLKGFLKNSVILRLRPARGLFSEGLCGPCAIFCRAFFSLGLICRMNPRDFLPPPAIGSTLLGVGEGRLFFSFGFGTGCLTFVSYLLRGPSLSMGATLGSVFEGDRIESVSRGFNLGLGTRVIYLSPDR